MDTKTQAGVHPQPIMPECAVQKSAVVDLGRGKLWGAPAWWLWGLVHVGPLVGIRNRVSTMLDWFWSYLTFPSAIRLITGTEQATPGGVRAGQPQASNAVGRLPRTDTVCPP